MSPKEYRAAISSLGLTQVGAAEFLRIDERTSRRWALGQVAIPEPAAMLLRLTIHLDMTPAQVIKITRAR